MKCYKVYNKVAEHSPNCIFFTKEQAQEYINRMHVEYWEVLEETILTDDDLQDLVDKMQYKSQNIKAKLEPCVFEDVIVALKELQEYRQHALVESIYTEDDL